MANTDKLWLEDWEKRQYQRFRTAKMKWLDLMPIITWHLAAGVFRQKQTLYDFACKQTKSPVAFWYADPITTSLRYDMKGRFDGIRKVSAAGKLMKIGTGYTAKVQTLPMDCISYGMRSGGGRCNFRNNFQIEDLAYASDAGLFTEDELYNRGLILASMAEGIMRFYDMDWIPQPYLNVGLPYPQSAGKNNGQRIPMDEFMTNMGGKNVLQHSIVSGGNTHGDCGALDFGTICEIARNELNQKTPAKKKAPAKKVKTSVKKSARKDTPSAILGDTADLLDKAAKNIKQIIGELK